MASSPRRSVPLALKIATLPPLAMGSPMDEKAQLPCIMITPSSPTHEYDYEFFTFHPEPKQPSFLSTVRQAFSFSTRSTYISLPESPNPNYTPAQRPAAGWSVSKRFRAVLLLAALLFFMLHLCVLPSVDHHGLYDAFTAHSEENVAAGDRTMWEVVPDVHGDSIPAAVAVAPQPAAPTGLAFDADDTVNSSLL